ncbi:MULTISPECIES: PepSY domain-containing protein [unclassified Streptomyces]|uniref:PepSY domain-containing protein n=1 Tax=unclassified Streptomyces TaxID=2593676 RepID=UPI002B1E2DB6|nr:PepSY domain-containing protein [Streptomyces sp. NBC_00340]
MKRNIVIATVAAAALIAGGTATSLAVTGDGTTAPTTRSSGQPGADDRRDDKAVEGTNGAGGKAVTAQDAIARALEHTPGTAVGAELDDENGAVVWEVEVVGRDGTWHDVRVSPAAGTVLGSRTEHEDDAARVRAALDGTSVSAVEAARAAAAKGRVTEIDLDVDRGTPAWKVETLTSNGVEREWRVGLDTARITADHRSDDRTDVRSDDRADDRNDDRADDRAAHDADDDRTGATHERGSDDGAASGSDDGAGHTGRERHGAGHGSDDGPEHHGRHGSDDSSDDDSGHGSDDD